MLGVLAVHHPAHVEHLRAIVDLQVEGEGTRDAALGWVTMGEEEAPEKEGVEMAGDGWR